MVPEKIAQAWEEAGRKEDLGEIRAWLGQGNVDIIGLKQSKIRKFPEGAWQGKELEALHQANVDQQVILQITDFVAQGRWQQYKKIPPESRDKARKEGSRRFLVSQLDLLAVIRQFPNADPAKEKEVISYDQGIQRKKGQCDGRQKERKKWTAP